MSYNPNDVRTWPIVASPDFAPAAPAAEPEYAAPARQSRLWMVSALAVAVAAGATAGVIAINRTPAPEEASTPNPVEISPSDLHLSPSQEPSASPSPTEALAPPTTPGKDFTLPAELTRFSTSYVVTDSTIPTRWVSFLQKTGKAYKTSPKDFPGVIKGVATTSLAGLGTPGVFNYDPILSEDNNQATFTIDRAGLWIDLDRQGITANSVARLNKAGTEGMLEQEFGDENVRHRDARRLIELQRAHSEEIAALNTFFLKKQISKGQVGNTILSQAEAVAKLLLESAAQEEGISASDIEFAFTGEWSPGVWDFVEDDKPALARQDDFRYKPENADWKLGVSPVYEGVES